MGSNRFQRLPESLVFFTLFCSMMLPDSSIHLILTTFPICIYIMMTMKNADFTIKNIIALSILANFVRYQSVRFSIFWIIVIFTPQILYG